MFHTTHKRLYQIAGAVWLLIGFMLLRKGIQYLCMGWDGSLVMGLLTLCALSVGIVKGRLILAKAALRSQQRIALLEEPTSLAHLYTRRDFLIILSMMGLGFLLNAFNIPTDIRAFIDIAIGAALIRGSLSYFAS